MRNRYGFTVVELILVISISSVVIIGLVPTLVKFSSLQYGQILRAKQINDSHKAISVIDSDLERTIEFRRAPLYNNIDYPAPLRGWNYRGAGSSMRTLILTLPATTKPLQDKDRELSTIADKTENCGKSDKPYKYNVVYYVHDSRLYRRSIVQPPEDKIICKYPYESTTKFPDKGSPRDILLLNNVDRFEVNYHNGPSLSPDSDSYAYKYNSPPLSLSAIDNKVVSIKITTKYNINDKEYKYSIHKRKDISW